MFTYNSAHYCAGLRSRSAMRLSLRRQLNMRDDLRQRNRKHLGKLISDRRWSLAQKA